MAELNLSGITKSFGDRLVLDGVDLTVASGTLTALLGPSGSGKTTILRLVCGFERADHGSIRIGGEIVSGPGLHKAPEARRIGYVAQDGALFPHLSVAENITFGLARDRRRQWHRVGELLDIVGLPQDYADRPLQALSGGEQQRISLARALAPEPALILLDEPFSALDAGLRIDTRAAVADALRRSGATALLVTHDQSEALSMGNQVAVLLSGRLVQAAAPDILYRRPIDPEVARFVGEAILLEVEAREGAADCMLGRLRLAEGMPQGSVMAMIRPEQLRLVSPEAALTRGGVVAVAERVTYYGHDAAVRLALPGTGRNPTFTARVPGHKLPRPHQQVGVLVEGEVITYARQSSDAG